MSLTDRSYASGKFAMTLDGAKVAAYIKSVEGGFTKANLTDEAIGPDLFHIKHLSTREIEAFSVEMGLAGSRSVLMWIQESWNKDFSRRDGQITHGDFNMFGRFEHHFTQALILETAFPTLDGSAREAGYLKFKFMPEAIETKKAAAPRIIAPSPDEMKLWRNHQFRLIIDGVDMSKSAKVEGFAIKQGYKAMHTGRALMPEIEPTKIEFPDLSAQLSLHFADQVLDWYKETVRQGGKDPAMEKTGTIHYLSPDTNTTIFSIKLEELGIRNASIVRSEANQDAIKRLKVDLYAGKMTLIPGPGLS